MARKKETKRSDGYYEYKCIVERQFDGTPIYKSFYSKKSKADARLKAEQYKSDLEKKANETEDILFEDWARIFLDHRKEQMRSSSYVSNYELVFEKHIIPFFKGKLLKQIMKKDIEDYAKYKADTLAGTTINIHITRLGTCFSDAIDNGFITINPCRKVKKPQDSKKKNIYTEDEAELVLSYCHEEDFGLHVHIILSYGMSRSEYLGIKYEDVDFDNLTISINKSIYHKTKYSDQVVNKTKNKYRDRVIAISKETADFIREKVTSGFLFTNSEEPPDTFKFERQYKQFMARMQKYYMQKDIYIPILNLHELRHTRASIWVNKGKNLFAIAEMLGWSDLNMLRKVYGHPDIQQLRKDLEI